MTRQPKALRRDTVARHATLPSPSALSTGIRLLGAALGVIAVSAIAIAAFVVVDLGTRATDDAVALEGAPEIAPPGLGEYPGAFDVLVLGTDECGPISKQYLGERCEGEDGILNDANLIIHVSKAPRRVTIISFPRDLMVEVPSCVREDGFEASAMSKQPLNSIYAHAGLSCVAKTIGELAELQIGFAAKLSFDGVIEMTDAIGGVEVCIGEGGMSDAHTGIDWPAGSRTVEGVEALQFLRTRHGVGDESDLARISNQQQYMSRLAKKLLSSDVLSDPSTLLRLANTVAENIVPSDTLSNPLTLGQLGLAVREVPFTDFVFLQYPTLPDPDDPSHVVPDYDAADQMWAALDANESLVISGGASPNGGVEEVEPTDPIPAETAPAETAEPNPTATLPPEITGTNIDRETCSAGNLR